MSFLFTVKACVQHSKPIYIHLNLMQFIHFNYKSIIRNKQKITYQVLLTIFFDATIPTVCKYAELYILLTSRSMLPVVLYVNLSELPQTIRPLQWQK